MSLGGCGVGSIMSSAVIDGCSSTVRETHCLQRLWESGTDVVHLMVRRRLSTVRLSGNGSGSTWTGVFLLV